VAKQDLKEVYAPIRSLILNVLIIYLVSAVLVYWLAALSARKIAQPILAITEVSKKIRAGDLSIRNQVQGQDELGYLAETFNKMADEISSRIVAIKKAETELHREKNSLEEAVEERTMALQQELEDRMRAEEALLESEREKDNILNSMSEALVLHDRELKNIWVNKAAADTVDKSPDDLAGLHCYSIWFDREEPCEGCRVLKTIETGETLSGEDVFPDGRIFLSHSYPVLDSKGYITGAIEVCRDITEQRLSQEKILRAKEEWERTFNSIDDIITIHDTESRITLMNASAARFSGYDQAEAMGIRAFVTKPILKRDLSKIIRDVLDV